MKLIAIPLGWIMKLCYMLLNNYGLALLLFTFITRLLVFPLNIKQQKSSARMAMLKPELDKLQKKYAKNQQKLQEEQMNLYAKAGVNPMASCLPMIITLVILWALIPVIYGPLTYVSGINKDDISNTNKLITNISTVSDEIKKSNTTIEKLITEGGEEQSEEEGDSSNSSQVSDLGLAGDETVSGTASTNYKYTDEEYDALYAILTDSDTYPKTAKILKNNNNVWEVIKLYPDIDTFVTNEDYFSQSMLKNRPELMTFTFAQKKDGYYSGVLGVASEEVEEYCKDFHYDMFGVNMGTIPKLKSITCLVPILCFALQLLVTFISQHYSKKNNPDMANLGGMTAMLYIMPLFSLWLGFTFPLGMGLYWCYSSLFSIIQTIVLNKIYTPDHVAELVERDIAKEKASGKVTFMQRMAEAQMAQSGKDPAEVRRAIREEMGEEPEDEPKKLSKAQLKDEQRRKLNEARKRMAQKYGDEYDESQD